MYFVPIYTAVNQAGKFNSHCSPFQLSWISTSLANPDVFCFAEFNPPIVNLEILKSPPDEENRDILTWKSLPLVEILLHLSEKGHYQAVAELFKFPMHNCPDMLVLSLLQVRCGLYSL
jgi:CCR4-NOT transcription complex subunit 1